MTRITTRKPLNTAELRQMALLYVGRYATTQAKLARYLSRKLRERGWEDPQSADHAMSEIVAAMVHHRFIDDCAYAEMKAEGLTRRGYGPRRIQQALGAAGIDQDSARHAMDSSGADADTVALAYAKRRRLGPYSTRAADPKQRDRDFAAMIRAGHEYATVRRILDLEPEVVHNSDARSDC